MPMDQLERDTVAKMSAICKEVLASLEPRLHALNEIYNASGTGVSSTLSQAEMDEEPALAGLQKTTLDDAAYGLTAQVLPAITAAYAALAAVGARNL
jgi:hypothetical protein